jgi:hypothetical protein
VNASVLLKHPVYYLRDGYDACLGEINDVKWTGSEYCSVVNSFSYILVYLCCVFKYLVHVDVVIIAHLADIYVINWTGLTRSVVQL